MRKGTINIQIQMLKWILRACTNMQKYEYRNTELQMLKWILCAHAPSFINFSSYSCNRCIGAELSRTYLHQQNKKDEIQSDFLLSWFEGWKCLMRIQQDFLFPLRMSKKSQMPWALINGWWNEEGSLWISKIWWNVCEIESWESSFEQSKMESAEEENLGARREPGKGKKDKKLGHRKVREGGQVVYKEVETNVLMGSIQRGIQQSVGGLASSRERWDWNWNFQWNQIFKNKTQQALQSQTKH